ncbi:MAG: peptidylprolyl isomerase [Bacillota bacterium]|nr:MAG: foldase [Bacillota bacterium]
MKKTGYVWIVLTFGFAALSGILGAQVYSLSQRDMARAPVATVNGEVITKQELYDALVAQGGPQTLERLIQDRLVRQEARKAGVTVTAGEVQAEIDKIKEQMGGEAQFQFVLGQYGMTLEDLKQRVETNLYIKKILEPQIRQELTEEKLRQYFEEHKEDYEFRARHILVETEEEANQIVEQLKAGADFAALAKEKSKDTASAVKGGDLGFFGRGEMVPEFEEAVLTAPVGGDPQVVKSAYGYHVVQVLMRSPTFEQVRDEVESQALEDELSARSVTWMEELKEKAQITNTLAEAET